MARFSRSGFAFLLGFLALVAVGCGGRRASLEGKITYDGKPIPKGSVRLFQQGNTPGFGASAPIQNGHFVIAKDQGLFAGNYRVEVRATKTTGPLKLPDEGIPGLKPPEELQYEYLPDRYNDQSTLEVTLEPNENQHDFDLERDEKWEKKWRSDLPEWIQKALP